MIRTKDIMASLPLVASILGDKYGVTVNIGGNQACTDGKTIHLPTLPLDCDAELLALARSFVDHEAAHIRYTDFGALRDANLTPMQKHLWNTLEDWRCENALAEVFPGCRQHFRWLIQHHFGKEDHNDMAGVYAPAMSVLNWVLLTVRAWDVPSIEKRKRTEAAVVRHAYPGLLSRLDTVLDRVRRDCRTTQNAIDYALELAAVIEEYTRNPAAKQKEGEEKREDSRTDSPDTDTSGIAPESRDDAFPDEEKKADSDCAALSEEDGYSDSQTQSARDTARKYLKTLIQASVQELPKPLGEHLAEVLSAQRIPDSQPGLRVAHEGHKIHMPLEVESKRDVLRSSIALRTRLHGLLQAITRQPCISGRRGRLQPQRLYALSVNDPRVFLKRGEKRQTSTAVHLLLDSSGSMDSARMSLAGRTCYAMAVALGGCKGVNVGVTAFPANMGGGADCTVAPLVRHGERVHDRFDIRSGGYTPLAEALWWVMQRMIPLRETRKIILILSDGRPDSVPAAQYALRQAATLGFEVMGLGIQDNNMALLLPTASRTINKLPELAPAMFGMLQKALLGRQGEQR